MNRSASRFEKRKRQRRIKEIKREKRQHSITYKILFSVWKAKLKLIILHVFKTIILNNTELDLNTVMLYLNIQCLLTEN